MSIILLLAIELNVLFVISNHILIINLAHANILYNSHCTLHSFVFEDFC